MIPSPYNSLLRLADGTGVAYNHVSGRLLTVSDAAYDYLEGKPGAPPLVGEYRRLVAARLLVAHAADERRHVRARLAAARADSSRVHYTLVTTYRCNLACSYCYQQETPARLDMSKQTAALACARMRREVEATGAPRLSVSLYGGEPLLNLDTAVDALDELGAWCRARGVELGCSLISNGTLVDAAALERLAGRLHLAHLTLDGGPRRHDAVRRRADGSGTFAAVLEAARGLLERGIRVVLRVQITPDALGDFEECLTALAEAGLFGHPLLRLYCFPLLKMACSSKVAACGRRYYDPPFLLRLWGLAKERGANVFDRPAPVWEKPYCSFVNRHAWLIDPLGDVYKCVARVGDARWAVGNLEARGTPHERRRARQAEAFVLRSGAALDTCRGCECLPSCDGGCAYLAWLNTGREDAPSCDLRGRPVRQQLQFLAQTTLPGNHAPCDSPAMPS